MNIELATPIEMCQDDKSLLIRFTYHAMVRLEQRGITELSVISDLFNVYQGIDSVDEFEKFSVVNTEQERSTVCSRKKENGRNVVVVITVIDDWDITCDDVSKVLYSDDNYPTHSEGGRNMTFDNIVKAIKYDNSIGRKWQYMAKEYNVSQTLCVCITNKKALRLPQSQEANLVFEMLNLGATEKQIVSYTKIKKPLVKRHIKEYWKNGLAIKEKIAEKEEENIIADIQNEEPNPEPETIGTTTAVSEVKPEPEVEEVIEPEIKEEKKVDVVVAKTTENKSNKLVLKDAFEFDVDTYIDPRKAQVAFMIIKKLMNRECTVDEIKEFMA